MIEPVLPVAVVVKPAPVPVPVASVAPAPATLPVAPPCRVGWEEERPTAGGTTSKMRKVFSMKVRRVLVLRLAAVTVLTAWAICAQAPLPVGADDPGGWAKAKWGMTEDDLKAAFPQIGQVQDEGRDQIGLPRYIIANHLYAVAFFLDKEKGLRGVHIIFKKKLVKPDGTELEMVECGGVYSCPSAPQSTSKKKAAQDTEWAATQQAYIKAEMNEQAVRLAKDDLLNGLTNNYGNPTSVTMKTAGLEEFIWRFPTTEITLMWVHGEFKQLHSIQLFYAFRKKSPDF